MKKRYVLGGLAASGLLVLGYQHQVKHQAKIKQEAVRQKIKDQAREHQQADQQLRAKYHDEVKDKFYYQQLSQEEQANYLRLLAGLRQFDHRIDLASQNEVRNTRVFLAVAYDHPEFYWLSETKYSIDFLSMTYPDDAKRVQAQLHAMADEVIAKLPQGSDYDKVKYIYEYIIQNTDYNLAALDNVDLAWANQSIRSVFMDKTSICNGYSLAFHFLCQKAGLDSIYIAGDITASTAKHAWNLVKIDGKYCPVDTTWGDPVFSEAVGGQAQTQTIDYSYLCMPRAIFERTHLPDETFFEAEGGNSAYLSETSAPFDYPEIEANGLNYHQLHGGYFDTYNLDQIGSYLSGKLKSNQQVTVQIGSLADYDRLVADLQADRLVGLHDYLRHDPAYQGYNFLWDPSSQTLVFSLI